MPIIHPPISQLQMIWPERLLDSPPKIVIPPGYSLRTYQPGDETRFFEIMELAGWPGWDDARLRPWLYRILPDGWFMVVEDKTHQIAATCMATHDPTWIHPFCGELAWLATDPAYTGRGFGTAVAASVTGRFLEVGYRRIHFYTEYYRLAAIKIYLRLGYVPYLDPPEVSSVWEDIFTKLGQIFSARP